MKRCHMICYRLSCCLVSRNDIIIKSKLTSCPNTILLTCLRTIEKQDTKKNFIIEYLEGINIKKTEFEVDIKKTIELDKPDPNTVKEIENNSITEIFKNRTDMAKFINRKLFYYIITKNMALL